METKAKGGKRQGSGRKRKEPTLTLSFRVRMKQEDKPELMEKCKEFISNFLANLEKVS